MKTVGQTFIMTILTVFGLTSYDNTNQTNTIQTTTTADNILNAENDSIYYPSNGLYGHNILLQGQYEYTSRQNSLNVMISNGKNVKIKITKITAKDSTSLNTGIWYYYPKTNRNWTISEFDDSTNTQTFSSNFGGRFCDVMMLFEEGTFQIDYYENKSLIPTTTKTITADYHSAHKTIQYDNVFYPKVHFPEWQNDYYDTNFVKQLLRTGEFHRDVVWSGAEGVKWFGLFKNESGFYLRDTKIRTQHVYIENDCYDPEIDTSDKTGIEVQIINPDTCFILIPEFDFLKNHKILQADLSQYISKNIQEYPEYGFYYINAIPDYNEYYPLRTKSRFLPGNQIFPGDTVKLNYLGVDYKIYATGSKGYDVQYLFEWNNIFNYKLYLSANKNGQIINQLLIAQNDTREMISILFAGDIDGDGFLDLLIERTYYDETKTLFLSKPAYNEHLLKVVGELRNPVPPCC